MNNTGAGCSTVFKDTRDLIAVPLYADDGTRNGIDLENDVLDEAYFTARVNDPDPSKRWYPIASSGGLKNVTQDREDPVYETFTDGSKDFVRDGAKAFNGWITGPIATPKYAGKLNSMKCVTGGMGLIKIDTGGNIVGSISDDRADLYPIAIDTGSFYAKYIEAKAGENNARIALMFDFSQNELDQNLEMIACSEMDYNIFQLRGLLDVCPVFSDIETTGFVATLKTEFGTVKNPVLVKGLTAANFTLFNNTTSSSVTISSVTESPDGVYTFTFAAQTAGDELTLTPDKDGYDFACVVSTDVVIPSS